MPVCTALPDATLRRVQSERGRRVERSGRRLMIHANLVDSGVFFGVAALTLLLMMFVYAVITADPEEVARSEAPLTQSPVLAPPPLPVRGGTSICAPHVPHPDRAARRHRLCGHTSRGGIRRLAAGGLRRLA